MSSVKQTIVIRKDLNIKKGRLASLAISAAMKFIIDNNDAERGDELHVQLSSEEADWIRNLSSKEVLGIDSQDALSDLVFRAELAGVNVYSIFDDRRMENDQNPELLCAAFGPDNDDIINQIIGNLKPL